MEAWHAVYSRALKRAIVSEQQVAGMSKITSSGESRPRWWRRFLVYPTFFGAVLGAVPTAIDLYKSFDYGIEYTSVKNAEEQRKLWIKNFSCAQKLTYQQIKTSEGIVVQVGACTNGDVLIEVVQPDSNRILQWISLDRLRTAAAATSALSMIATAHASAVFPPQEPGEALTRTLTQDHNFSRLAQAKVGVMCQKLVSSSKIIRIIKENGKCYREEINVLKGTVTSRAEVPCSTTCS